MPRRPTPSKPPRKPLAHMLQVLGPDVQRADDPAALGAVMRGLAGPARRPGGEGASS